MLLAPHELPPVQAIDEMLDDARRVDAAGFDGVLLSEHHGGLAGYLPNPLQFIGWALGETSRVWGAPCPLLLPLRPTGIVAEEAAWLAVRFPGRVGLGVAVGAAPDDFLVAGVPFEERSARYRSALAGLVGALAGRAVAPLANDPAIRRCDEHPVPVVCATTTTFGVKVAAAAGAGIMLDGLSPLSRSTELADAYRAAGGHGPVVLSRRAWLGDPPTSAAAEDVTRYAAFTSPTDHARMASDDSMLTHHRPAELAALLVAALDATGADCLSLRVNLPGTDPTAVREQIARFGTEVLPLLRDAAS